MIKKILFTILILFSTFFLMENAYAYSYYYDINFQNALDFINSDENIVANDKNPKYYLDYIKEYIDSNNSNNFDYAIIYMYSPTSISFSHNHSFYVLFYNSSSSRKLFLSSTINNNVNSRITFLHYMSKKVLFTENTFLSESSLDSTLTELNTILNSSTISGSAEVRNVFDLPNQNVNSNISLNSNYFQFVPYYSTIENLFLFTQYPNDNSYLKDLLVNDILYVFGDYFPTIYNLNNPPTPSDPEIPPTFTNNSFISKYNGVFLSNIPKEQINNYQAEFIVGQVGEYNDFQYQPSFYGRINHGTYYTYEKINCSYQITSDEPYYEDFGIQKDFIRYDKKYFQFTSCTSDLTNYDNVYVSLHNLYYSQIFNFSSSANYGYISANDFLGNYVKVLDFYDLNKNSAYMLSLKNPNLNTNGTYFGSLNNQVFDLMYNKDNLSFSHISPGVPIDSKIFYIENIDSYYNNRNIMFDLSYSNLDTDTLLLVVDENSLVSYNSNYKENFQFTYYDNEENIVTNDFNVYEEDTSNNDYDLDNYFDIVSQFIDSLSSDINQFSEVLQNCYDLAPDYIQNIIFVLFILTMSYILFKLIGK